MTLLDYPKKIACTVFLSGCNFRCPFCHNIELAKEKTDAGPISEDQFFSFLGDREGILDGVAITGGEPLLNDGIEAFLRRIKEHGFLIKLDTNGSNPQTLEKCIKAGLVDYIAMDIKSSPGRYSGACGVPYVPLDTIKDSIRIIMDSGREYEFRTTVVDELHDEHEIEQIGRMIRGARSYYLQSFVNSPEVPCKGFHSPTRRKLVAFQKIAMRYVDRAMIRGGLD